MVNRYLAPRKPAEPGIEPRIGDDPVECDVVDVGEEVVRVDAMMLHQPGQRRAMVMEMRLLDAPRLGAVARQQALDIGAHALVDQVEQPGRRRVQAIVEIEDPVGDVGEGGGDGHHDRAPSADRSLHQMERFY